MELLRDFKNISKSDVLLAGGKGASLGEMTQAGISVPSGFVVLAMDMTGHGYSQGKVGSQRYGGPAALRYLRSLPTVDTLNIGLEGHSMGGGPILAAALDAPDDYRSMVLEGSSTG